MEKSLEQTFYKRLERHSTALVVGNRHSGKSVFIASMLRELITKNKYHEYHLVLQNFQCQANDTWSFLFSLPKEQQKRIKIYNEFDMEIIRLLVENPDKKRDKFLFIDDCTNIKEFYGNDPYIKKLFVMCRHLRVTVFLVYHYLSSCISRVLRTNSEFVFITRNLDEKFLTSLYEESFSLLMDKKEFLKLMRDEMTNKEYPCVALHRDTGVFDTKVTEWGSISSQRKIIMDKMKDTSITKIKNEPETLQKQTTVIPSRNPHRVVPSGKTRRKPSFFIPKIKGKKTAL